MKNNKKVLVTSTLLMAIVLLSVGTIAYFRRAVNGNITGNTGILVFNVNGLTGETSETLEYSLNRSEEEPYVYPDDSGYFDLEITAEGSSTDVYVTLDIIRDHLPDNLKFYTGEDHKVVINKKYFFFQKTGEMSDTLRIYWFWDGSKDDENDSLFINQSLSANISLSAEPMEYGMMKNGNYENDWYGSGFWQTKYRSLIKEITFSKELSGIPSECTEENLCWDISYEENQKYPVYAYLLETNETGIGYDENWNEITSNLYDLYIVSSKTVFSPINSKNLFSSFDNLRTINFNNWFNTSLVTDMSEMFYNNINLNAINTELFNTNNVTNMSKMFASCSNIEELSFETFETSRVSDMSYMFSGCEKLISLNLETFDTHNVISIDAMFYQCLSLMEVNLTSFDTRNVTDLSYMFSGCEKIKKLDLKHFNTSNVNSMGGMFRGCSNLTELDIENFETGHVTSMSQMFRNCSSLKKVELKKFDTTNVVNMQWMFTNCSNLTTELTILGIQSSTDSSSSYTDMFSNAATANGSQIIVNYIIETSSVVDGMVNTKSANSNVIKGALLSSPTKYTITLGDDSVSYKVNNKNLFAGTAVALKPQETNKYISSFKVNGETIMGNYFVLTEDSIITDVVMYDIIVESDINIQAVFESSDNFFQGFILKNDADKGAIYFFTINDVPYSAKQWIFVPKNTVGNIHVIVTKYEYLVF